MEKGEDVMVHGMWASSFCMRVEIALKLKGIPYKYVEEDLSNKSDQLVLHYNPIHKKVPVLVHKGKPIAESLVILEYIEDNWKHEPLLPQDPHKRAMVRFWANFTDKQLVPNIQSMLKSRGEEEEKQIIEFLKNLQLLEEGIKKEFSGGGPFFNGEKPGFLDIVVGASHCWHRALEEMTGVELIKAEKNPVICSCLAAFMDLEAVKETMPEHAKLVAYGKHVREKCLMSSARP